MKSVRFGVNFIPSKNWLHSWVNWDANAIEEDLIAVKELGADHIRVNLLWHYFQLDSYVMSTECMKHLSELRCICEKINMDFCVSLFTGFMSGLFFLPGWQKRLTGAFLKGVFQNPEMIKSEEFYIRQIASVVADSPNFIGFDLGNELTAIANNDPTVSVSQCDEWNNRMLDLCNELAPGKLNNNGVDHQPWFNGSAFSREVLANTGAITPLHCYSLFTEALERFGRMSTESIHLAPFMVEMAKAFSDNPNRLYWIQEFGTVTESYNEEIEEFVRKSIYAMFTSENLWGITWWCSHNISREYTSFAKIEYELGLLDINNKPTPSGKLFKKIADDYKSSPIIPKERKFAFTVEPTLPDGTITYDYIWEIGHRYAQYVENGIYPAIVLSKNSKDTNYLKKRGITDILN